MSAGLDIRPIISASHDISANAMPMQITGADMLT
jgi:hypothetical protein